MKKYDGNPTGQHLLRQQCLSLVWSALFVLALAVGARAAVLFERVPEGGIQPQVIIGPNNVVHLLYFKGDAAGGDIFYARKTAGDSRFGEKIKVNQRPGSAIVAGTMRGPQMALGKGGRVHVVWMGGNGATKAEVAGQKVTPLLYTRLDDSSKKFEPERNILTHIAGLDGGQTVAADQSGNVYVIWHGAPPETEGEEDRGLYVARSRDEGLIFAREEKANVARRGSCACCGIRATVDEKGALNVLFRSAEAGVNRPQLWLRSTDYGKNFEIVQEDAWTTATCPASSMSFAEGKGIVAGAWETNGRVVAGLRRNAKPVLFQPGESKGKQKHPRIALNERGETLLTWVEDAGWGMEGTLVYQRFGADGKAMGEPIRKGKVPAWSFGAPYVAGNGDFVLMY